MVKMDIYARRSCRRKFRIKSNENIHNITFVLGCAHVDWTFKIGKI